MLKDEGYYSINNSEKSDEDLGKNSAANDIESISSILAQAIR